MFFRSTLLSIVLSLPLVAAAEASRSGEVTSIETIKLIQEDLSVVDLKVDGQFKKYSVWENLGTIELWTDDSNRSFSECGAKSQGRLEKPVSIQVKSNVDDFTITIPAHRAIVFNKSKCGKDGSVRHIQIDVKDDEKGKIVFDASGETQNKDEVQSFYSSLRASNSEKLSDIERQISQKDFETARLTFAGLVVNELYSSDLKKLNEVYASFPSNEAPVPAHKSSRYTIEDVEKMFSVDIDSMTTSEFLSLVKDFADNPRNERREGDESYLFRLMSDFNIADKEKADIYIQTLEARITLLKELAKSGTEVEFDLSYNTKGALTYLVHNRFAQEQAERVSSYLSSFKAEFMSEYNLNSAWRAFVDDELYMFRNKLQRDVQ